MKKIPKRSLNFILLITLLLLCILIGIPWFFAIIFLMLFSFLNIKSLIITNNIFLLLLFFSFFFGNFFLKNEINILRYETVISDRGKLKKNIHKEYDVKFGDLILASGFNENVLELAKTKKIEFKTNKFGFRKVSNEEKSNNYFVGDSFVLGVSNTQKFTFPEILSNQFKYYGYNLGYPGDPNNYFEKIEKFTKKNSNVLLFIFEGNDFFSKKFNFLDFFLKLYHYQNKYVIFSKQKIDDLIFNYISSLVLKKLKIVKIENINEKSVGYFNHYIHASLTHDKLKYIDEKLLKKNLNKIKCIFYIPTKFSSHIEISKLTNKVKLDRFRDKRIKEISDLFNMEVYDLTNVFRENFKKGKLLFFEDDSHLNNEGNIELAKFVNQKCLIKN